jgi:hypothetical protein
MQEYEKYTQYGATLCSLDMSATSGPTAPASDDQWVWSSQQNENLQGKLKCSEQIFPLPTRNPI